MSDGLGRYLVVKSSEDTAVSDRFKGLKRPSTAIVMAMVWQEHADLLTPSSRPLRWAIAGLGHLGRLLGYRTL